jgi:hypothetical protein
MKARRMITNYTTEATIVPDTVAVQEDSASAVAIRHPERCRKPTAP